MTALDNLPQQQLIIDTLEKNFMPYAMSVIVSRAIPEIDGFKPSHRKLLYTMYKMGLLQGARTKSANVVGQTMKLNPHGDQAIYETLVRLTRGNEALLHPFIDSKGNFGRIYSRDMQYAASRYTEVKLEKICEVVFGGIEKDSVDFIENYDNTQLEPLLLPTAFPAILVNSNQGIAVGMASNICSFNLQEVCQAAIAYIKDPGFDLAAVLPAPDFSTGAELIYDQAEMARIYQTGRGSFRLRATYNYDKKKNLIEINQIPYTTTVEAIIDDLAELVKKGRAREIIDVRDETDLQGLKITIECRRATDPHALMQKLFQFSSLESSFACNFNVLINGSPRVLGVKQLLGEWLAWRRSCLKREIVFDLDKKQERLHLLRGLEKILLDIDKAIQIIRNTAKEADVLPNLMAGFAIDAAQAEFVANIRLRQLNRQYILDRTADISGIEAEIADLHDILAKKERMDQLICQDLKQIGDRYGKPRQTRLVKAEKVERIDTEDLIEDYRLKLYLTEHGYLKKLALTSLRSAGELKTKEEDKIKLELEGTNKSDVIFISDQGTVYKMKCYEINDHKPADLGEFTPNLLELPAGERIVHVLMTDDYSGQLLFAFANGKFTRLALSVYETKTNRRRLVNAYSTASPLVEVLYLDEGKDEDIFAVSDADRALIFSSSQVPLRPTRTNQGIQVLQSRKGSQLTSCQLLSAVKLLDEEKRYRRHQLPALGVFLKENSLEERQISLDGI